MAIVQSTFNTLTGGKGNIGAWNRNVALWKGRAAAKRTEARIDALEKNVNALNNQQAEIAQVVEPSNVDASPLVSDTLKNINPLNVKNLTVTQIVVTGGSTKDKLKAEKIAEKNTKLLEQFNKATKEIAKNTKQIKKQDTKIRKKQSIKDRANNYAKTAKKLALKAAKKTKGWIANMKDYLISILPSLILATLMASGAIMGKIVKKVTDKIRGGTRAERKAAKAKAAEWKEKETKIKQYVKQQDRIVKSSLNRRIGGVAARVKFLEGALKTMQMEIAACCGLRRKRKGGGKRGPASNRTTKPNKPSVKKTSTVKVNKNEARLMPKGVTDAVRKTKRSAMFKLLKKLGTGGIRTLAGMAGAAMAFAGPLISVILGAWFAYDMVSMGLVMSGVITEEQLEQFEDYIINKAKELVSGTYKKLTGGGFDKSRQKKIERDRVIRESDKYYEEAEEALEELRNAIESGKPGNVVRRLRYKFGKAVTHYNKVVNQGGSAAEGIKLFIFRHLEQTDFLWHERFRTDTQKKKEADFIKLQMTLFEKEKNGGVSKTDVKGTNVKSSSVQRSTALKSGGLKQRTLSSSMKKVKYSIEGVDAKKYQNDITFTLGTPVNGLYPPMWKPLETLVPPAYRKVIDFLENGNTANYALKGKRSSAYGRYQFMEKTARGMAKKTPGIDASNWKVPENQDRIFATLYQENMRYLSKLAARGIKIDLMSLWIAHNLGPGAVEWMLTGQGKKVPKHHIDLQLGKTGSTAEESRQLYLNLYKEKIAKAIGAPVGKGTLYGTISGTGTPGIGASASPGIGANASGGLGGGVFNNGSVSGVLPSLKVEPWNGEVQTNINMKDVIELKGGATRSDAWRMLKPEFKTRILQAAAAFKEVTGKKLVITSAYRDIKKQTELWNKSDKTGRTVARPGSSMHNWGLAIDLGGSSGVDRGQGNQGDILAKSGILAKFKLWRPMSYEPWHIEPIETKGHRGLKGQYVQLQSTSSVSTGVSNQTPVQFTAPVTNPYVLAGSTGAMGSINSTPSPTGVPVVGSTTPNKIHTGSNVSLKNTISVKERKN